MTPREPVRNPIFRRASFGASALLLLAVLFIGLVVLVSNGLPGLRLDLTENKLYTLSPGTREIVSGLEEPVNLYFFFSSEVAEQEPMLKGYATRVRELLQEIAARSGGKIRLNFVDPEPFSEEEDQAAEFGIAAIPFGAAGEKLYFGLAGTNSTDGRAVIEFFQLAKEKFLEYDIARLVVELSQPEKPVVGLLTSLPMTGGFDPSTMQPTEGWAVISQLDQLVNVRSLNPTLTAIDADVDVLMLVHPKDLSQSALYAIDQFVMRGGRLLVFVDPQSEADTSGQDPQNPFGAMGANRSSTLEPLFKAWGIEFDIRKVVGDRTQALMVGMRAGEPPVRHLGIIGLMEDSIDPDDVITAALDNINVATAGTIGVSENSGLELEPLLTSSPQSALIPVERFTMLMDPTTLHSGFRPTGERFVIAGRISGKLKSAFPNGPPSDSGQDKPAAPVSQGTQLEESKEAANLVVVADTDLLSDMLWVRNQSFFGQRFAQAIAHNGDFVANAIDNLTGSSALISIRGRASFTRPFDKVEELRVRAEDRFRLKEQELDQELRNTEQKLTELQSPGNGESALILSPEQEAELERFQQEKLRIRKELRDVRHGLQEEIDRLGTMLKVLNILVVPLAVCLIALGAWLWRRRHATAVARGA
jgi:ABC-type uncharacterized transport system involved in gliding motility auxiliary subunit